MKWHRIKLIAFLGCLFTFSFRVTAGELKYPVSDIPKALMSNSKAVVREHASFVEIKGNGKFTMKVLKAITILNKNGSNLAAFTFVYDKNIKVNQIKAKIFNAMGIEVKIKGGIEVEDYSAVSSGTLYTDARVKVVDPEYQEYPYTIEYTYEVLISESINYPNWSPVPDYNVSVQDSRFVLDLYKGSDCRFFERNITSKATSADVGEFVKYTWVLADFAPLQEEEFSPPLEDLTPQLELSPSSVNVEGYAGDFTTWGNFGAWISKLNAGKNSLEKPTVDKVKQLVAPITDKREKIKAVYEFMQNRTHYVSVQIGIGGYQPFDAATVDRLCYGDCKALVNYTKSLLEAAGIDAYYTLVNAGDENTPIEYDFPSNQFNHVILCVPVDADTVWLECTDQKIPFNYLGCFTSDRNVLVISDEKGVMVRTPLFHRGAPLEARSLKLQLDTQGNAVANVNASYHGVVYDDLRPILFRDDADQKKIMSQRIRIPTFELDGFTLKEDRSEPPSISEHLDLSLDNYASKFGTKLMLNLNVMNRIEVSPFQEPDRKYDISFTWPIAEVDTVVFELPKSLRADKFPEKVEINSEFGSYTAKTSVEGDTLKYIRTFNIYQGKYDVSRYKEIADFFSKVVSADKAKAILAPI
jgi:transglutaminase-like putative cysteine protease